MNTNMKELSFEEMELVNGGVDLAETGAAAASGGIVGGMITGVWGMCLGLASGPVGWLILGGAAVCGVAGGIAYVVTR